MKRYAARPVLTADGRAIAAQLRAAIVRTGWSETARRCGLDRSALHRAFGPTGATTCPNFATIAVVAQAVGLTLTLTAVER